MTAQTTPELTYYYNEERQVMLDFIPEGVRRVLEVGCAAGKFGSMLKAQRNCEVWGIELFSDAAEVAARHLDKVLVIDVEADALPLPVSYFDCVIYNDVLEHLKDPWQHLRSIQPHLCPGGYVVASIPNIRQYRVVKALFFKGEWRYEKDGILDRTHLRFFTKGSIHEMFESEGYKVIRLEGINAEDFPWKFGVLNQLLHKSLEDMRYVQFACVAQYNVSAPTPEQVQEVA